MRSFTSHIAIDMATLTTRGRIEIVSLRLRAAGITQKPRIKSHRPGATKGDAVISHLERVYFDERAARVPVYDTAQAECGNEAQGSGDHHRIQLDHVDPERFKVEVDAWLNLIIEVS